MVLLLRGTWRRQDSISSTVVTGLPAAELPIEEVAETPANPLVSGINTVWMLLAAMLVFFMEPGFALVEAGFTRSMISPAQP